MMSVSKYNLNIYHRSIAAEKDEAGDISKDMSPGHLYVGFQDNDNEEEFFGFYKPDGMKPIGIGEIRTEKEKEMHKMVGILSQRDKKDYILGKQIKLTQDQYIKAIDYAKKRVSQDNIYIMGLEDCIDFTQSVYNAAGLPLYFTQIYSAEELSNLPNLTSYKMLTKYVMTAGLGEGKYKTGIIVEGLRADEVASRLNIPVDRVKLLENTIQGLYNFAADHMLLNFHVSLHESDILSKNLVKTITPECPDAKSSCSPTENDQLPSTSRVEQLTGLMALLELNGKLSRLKVKFNELKDEYCSEVECMIENMIKNTSTKIQADVNKNFNAELSSKVEQIKSRLAAYNNQLFNQKQGELTAETNERIAQARAQAAVNNSGSITVTNIDIAARKQSEYDSMLASYKQQCENEIKCFEKESVDKSTTLLNETIKNEITNKIDTMKNEVKKRTQELSSVLNEIAKNIIQGEEIDVEAVVNDLKVKLSGSVTGLKNISDV